MTITIILADDEPIILKGLRKLMPWEQLGMRIAGTAFDGKELLDLIETNRPDIVISDISMPHMTGIELIQELHRRGDSTKIIFISAYQEFAYAKSAIAYGAVDYLVKPLNKDDMEQALRKAVASIKREGELEERQSKLVQLEERSKKASIKECLEALTDGEVLGGSEGYAAVSQLFAGKQFSLGIVAAEVPRGGRWQEGEKRLVDFAVQNIISELLDTWGEGYVFAKESRHVYVAIHEQSAQPEKLAEQMKESIASYLKLEVSIGVAALAVNIDAMQEAYKQAKHALQKTYFRDDHRVSIFNNHEASAATVSEAELYELRAEVIDGLLAHTWEGARSSMQTMLERVASYASGNRALAVSACLSFIHSIIQEVIKMGIVLKDGAFELDKLQGQLEQYRSFQELQSGLIQLLESLYHHINQKASSREKLLIYRVKTYIDDHFAEEITLERTSAVIFMNAYYFSNFFKKHTGQNFKQYVTDIRMRHALKLLTTSDLMVYEIAEQCGYNNARHFSDMFKKHMGMLPQEYRQSK
ncbi:response regulator [Paenibacillus sp. strain BS8-2]